jgi:hypothetical protein
MLVRIRKCATDYLLLHVFSAAFSRAAANCWRTLIWVALRETVDMAVHDFSGSVTGAIQ